MLRLTPLKETISGQELLHEDRVDMLTKLIQTKFELTPAAVKEIVDNLQKLDLTVLEALFAEILYIETLEQLEMWINRHLPVTDEKSTP